MDIVKAVKHAAESLRKEAELLEEAHTLNGEWSHNELASNDSCLDMARQSEALKYAADVFQTTLKATTQAISIHFILGLQAILSERDLDTVRERNRQETSPGVCHTHDFCDANEVMALAFHTVVGRPFDADTDGPLWELSWFDASQKNFQLNEVDSDFFLLRIEVSTQAVLVGPIDNQIDLDRLTEIAKLDNCKALYHLRTIRGSGITCSTA